MDFKKAVALCPELAGAFRQGLRAIRRRDASRISARDARLVTGSINLDTWLGATYPNDRRWDYAIGYQAQAVDRVVWVEVHPAETSEVAVVLAKKGWLDQWLAKPGAAALRRMPRTFHWIASGAVHILRNSPQARRLALSGIILKARLEIQ